MNDLIMIVIRFLLYLDLMVIFGLPFFQIYGISGVRHETYNLTNFRSFITFAVVTGIILTGINGFAPIFPDTCYHLTHYWPAAVDIPVASDNPVHYADAIRYNARTPLQGSLLPLTRLV